MQSGASWSRLMWVCVVVSRVASRVEHVQGSQQEASMLSLVIAYNIVCFFLKSLNYGIVSLPTMFLTYYVYIWVFVYIFSFRGLLYLRSFISTKVC